MNMNSPFGYYLMQSEQYKEEIKDYLQYHRVSLDQAMRDLRISRVDLTDTDYKELKNLE